ncbi:hypothetical protein BT69DRAFT_490627 [Atractiella rhizophila]|nr:hypothetical protein BT69DRAFT_490627 [Atractiella rhizophila]
MDGGLTSLGLFRPYRLSENPTNIRRLISIYLLSLPTSSPSHAQLPAKSALRGWSGLSETEGEGEGWEKEMERANISDVAVVLKWALRHLDYGRREEGIVPPTSLQHHPPPLSACRSRQPSLLCPLPHRRHRLPLGIQRHALVPSVLYPQWLVVWNQERRICGVEEGGRSARACLVGLGERGRRGSEGEGVEAWKAGKERGTAAEIGGSG